MTPITARLSREDGFAVGTALIVMGVMLAVTGAVFASSVQFSTGSNKDDGAKRAFQAADAGVNAAISRLDQLKPAAGSCITTAVAAPAADGWCAETAVESLGNSQQFSYRVSASPTPAGTCAGDSLDANTGERCIAAVGSVNGVSRRVAVRVGATGSLTPFSSNTGLVGYADVTLKANVKVIGNVGANKKFSNQKNATIAAPYSLFLGPKGKAKKYTGPTVVKGTDFFPAPVSFFNPPASTNPQDDTAVKNDNHRMGGIAPPGVTYTKNASGGDRVLTVGDGKSVTLSGSGLTDAVTGLPVPAYYNFCKITLGKNAKINIAPGAWVRLYIDSKDRQGSRCSMNGELKAGKDSSFINGNPDPRSLQIYAWSKKTKLTIPNKSNFSALIYAPNSKVKFSNKGKLTGGVAAQKVELRKDMVLQSSTLLNSYSIPTLYSTQTTAWKQCQAYIPLSGGANPASDC